MSIEDAAITIPRIYLLEIFLFRPFLESFSSIVIFSAFLFICFLKGWL